MHLLLHWQSVQYLPDTEMRINSRENWQNETM